MWTRSENGSLTKPADIDTTSSKVYNTVRKDFEQVEATEEIPAHWTWVELKVRKEDWETYQQAAINAANIDYIAMMMDVEIPTEEEEEE